MSRHNRKKGVKVLRISTRTTWPAVLVLGLAWGAPAWSRTEWQVCGTHPQRTEEEIALHRRSMETLGPVIEARRASGRRAAARDIGNISVLDDTDGVVARRNTFNLDRRTVQFLPAAGGSRYKFTTSDGGYDAAVAEAASPLTGIQDDDTRAVPLPFSFPFFGRTHASVFVNSDGNLTFDEPDTAISERSLGRLTAGPPRISPLFMDLDPSMAPNSVRVLASPNRFTVSWVSVPEYTSFGFGSPNTFQVSLYPDGRVEMAWQGITSRTAMVGIAPGGLRGGSQLVSFGVGSAAEFSGAVVERFSSFEEIDTVLAAQKFFETHEDAYDYLVIYNNLGLAAAPGALAFEATVRSSHLGIGDERKDEGRLFGSPRRLQAILNMGPLSQYPRDPNALFPPRALAGDTALTTLGHETGHLWLAFASVRDGADSSLRPMLGRDGAHWSFLFNSEASLLEGNRIRDNGPDASPRFTTVATVEGYSALDQYLMGLRPPEEVPPTFYVANGTVGPTSRNPQSGVSFDGVRRNVTIEELIQAEGRRTPDHQVAQRRFRMGFLLIKAEGTEPTAEELAKLDDFRSSFEGFFHRATQQRAQVETSFKQMLDLSVAPAAGVLAGGRREASIGLASPAAAALTVMLRVQNGAASAPAAVTIAAGQQRAPFVITGARTGVDEITAEPADNRYAAASARIQVLAGPAGLSLAVVSGDKQVVPANGPLGQQVVLRVTDVNNLPYQGVEVAATVSNGLVQPARVTSDENGHVRFAWIPGQGLVHELQAALTSAPAVGAIVTAQGRPTIALEGVVNAASFAPGLTPGGLASVFGANLAGGVTALATQPLPEQLAGVRVTVGGIPARLLYASDRQVNFLTPPALAGNSADVVVSWTAGATQQSTVPVSTPVRLFHPGIFFDQAMGISAVLVAGTAQTTAAQPAAVGEVVEIYATGLGAVRASAAFPGLMETVTTPQTLIGGRAAEVLFSGLAPGFPGLYQVNARVPEGVGPGRQSLRLSSGASASNEVPVILR